MTEQVEKEVHDGVLKEMEKPRTANEEWRQAMDGNTRSTTSTHRWRQRREARPTRRTSRMGETKNEQKKPIKDKDKIPIKKLYTIRLGVDIIQ